VNRDDFSRRRRAAEGERKRGARQQKRVKRPADDAAVSSFNSPTLPYVPAFADNPRPRLSPSPTQLPRAGTDSLSGSLGAIESRGGGAKRASRYDSRLSFFFFFSGLSRASMPLLLGHSENDTVRGYHGDYGDIAAHTYTGTRVNTRVLSIRSVRGRHRGLIEAP